MRGRAAFAAAAAGILLLLAAVGYWSGTSPVYLRSVSAGELQAERSARSWAAQAFSGMRHRGGGAGEHPDSKAASRAVSYHDRSESSAHNSVSTHHGDLETGTV
jgi:hypothetical protein